MDPIKTDSLLSCGRGPDVEVSDDEGVCDDEEAASRLAREVLALIARIGRP